MRRQFTIILMTLALCWTTLACSSPTANQSRNPNVNTTSSINQLSNGKYPVQQAAYDDGTGEYTVMLLNTPPGTPPVYSTTDLRLARLTDAEIAAGEKTYLNVNNGQADMHLTEDFKIEYVHNVAQTQTNPQTGQTETVIVRQQSSFWAPFAGALAGQALGSLLFSPTYYVPPVYQSGGIMRGYGGYGSTYNQAIDRYQTRYNAPPPVVKNRQVFRTTGNIRKSPSSSPSTAVRRTPQNSNRATGSGVGTSTLRQSNKSNPSRTNRPSSSSFGSGGASRRSSGFGSRGFSGGRRR